MRRAQDAWKRRPALASELPRAHGGWYAGMALRGIRFGASARFARAGFLEPVVGQFVTDDQTDRVGIDEMYRVDWLTNPDTSQGCSSS
ncbi:MAG: hypothetical protein AB7F50_02895 [Fimbriimonadaceae bacterium]